MKQKNMRRRILAVFMALVFVIIFLPVQTTTAASPATRARLQEIQERQNVARQEVSAQRNLLEGTYGEMNTLVEQLQVLDQAMMDELAILETISIAIEETEVRIEIAEHELQLAEIAEDEQSELLRYRLRAMHEAGPVGFLDVLLHAESFADFFTLFEHVRAISRADQEALLRLEEIRNHRMEILDSLSREHMLALDLQITHQAQLDILEEQRVEREEWMKELQNDAEQLAMLLAILEAEEHAINVEFGVAEAQYRAEVAEAERRRQEAERLRREEEQRARMATQNQELARLNNFNGQFVWPLPTHSNISSGFGSRTHPISGRNEHHTGIDLPAPAGTRIVAAADGIVRTAGWSGGFGLTVIIDHGNGYSTLYAHNSRNRVTVGQNVTAGQHIADVGTTGVSTGNHLHFEIRRNGTPVDPMRYF